MVTDDVGGAATCSDDTVDRRSFGQRPRLPHGIDAVERRDQRGQRVDAVLRTGGVCAPSVIGDIDGYRSPPTSLDQVGSRRMHHELSLIHISEPTRLGMISY